METQNDLSFQDKSAATGEVLVLELELVEPQIRVCSEKGKRGRQEGKKGSEKASRATSVAGSSRPSPDREQCLQDHGNGGDSPVRVSSSHREIESRPLIREIERRPLGRERALRLDERSGVTDTGRSVGKETRSGERPDERGVSPGRTGAVMPGEEKTSTWGILEKDLALSTDDEEEGEEEGGRIDGEVMEGPGPQRYVNQNLVFKFSIFYSRCRRDNCNLQHKGIFQLGGYGTGSPVRPVLRIRITLIL